MGGPVRLTPSALASLLADLDHEAFVAFVADLRAREGRGVDREGSVLTLGDGSDECERLLVWTDGRTRRQRLLGASPDAPETGSLDAVVARDGDLRAARAIAEKRGARVVGPADLRDRLLYAIDRGACRELCREHFGREVVPRPAPESGREGADSAPRSLSYPPTIVVAAALTGVLVAAAVGMAGLPGASGPRATATPDAGATVGTAAVTPAGGGVATSSTPPPGTPPEFPGFSLDGDHPVNATPGSTITVSGVFYNHNDHELRNLSLSIESSSGSVTVARVNGTTRDTLAPLRSHRVTWVLEVGEPAAGEHRLHVQVEYDAGSRGERLTVDRVYTLVVSSPAAEIDVRSETTPPG
ncbi:MAG: hypothetical protein ABEH66_02585 [Halobacteriales archaeon]